MLKFGLHFQSKPKKCTLNWTKSEDAGQPACPHSLFRVFTVLITTLQTTSIGDLIVLGFNDKSREIEEIVEEMKETDREERGTGMTVKKQKK